MSSISDLLARLGTLSQNLAASIERTESNYRLSEQAKKEHREALRQSLREAVGDTAEAIFGRVGAHGLEGGVFWELQEALEAARRDALAAADTLDAARLSNAYRRLPSIVAGAANVRELQDAYENGDVYERRALQDVGPEALLGRFSGDPTLGGFLATLKGDRKTALTTPALEAAESELRTWQLEGADAHAELSRMASNLGGDALSLDRASRTLRAVRVSTSFEDVSDLNAPATVRIEKQDAGGVYWPA